MSCLQRDVASEQQLIQAWGDRCSLIHCQNTTKIGPAFFSHIRSTEPVDANITLSGTLYLEWVSSYDDLLLVRHMFNNGTVESEDTTQQLLPIQKGALLKMSNLQLLGWPTSMTLFMEMLSIPPPGPGLLLFENTTWTILDCTQMTSFLSYVALLSNLRQDVFLREMEISEILALSFTWDQDTNTMTVHTVPPLPSSPEQHEAGDWSVEQVVGFSNFSVTCSKSTGAQQRVLAAESQADPDSCRSRQVTTSKGMVDARLDDCRHVLALPPRSSNGTLLPAPALSQNWYQWDRNFTFNTTISGVLSLDLARFSTDAYLMYPIAPDAALEFWNLDVVASVAEVLNMNIRTRSAGIGLIKFTNTRLIIEGCTPELLVLFENALISQLAWTNAEDQGSPPQESLGEGITIDRNTSTIRYKEFSGTLVGDLGLFRLFDQRVAWDVRNCSILCREVWDLEESVERATRLPGSVPPSLRPEALGAVSSSLPAASSSQLGSARSGRRSSEPDRSFGIIVGVGVALGVLLAVALAAAALLQIKRRRAPSRPSGAAPHAPDAPDRGQASAHMEAHEAAAPSALHKRSSGPILLHLKSEERLQLLAVETCAETLTRLVHPDCSAILEHLQQGTTRSVDTAYMALDSEAFSSAFSSSATGSASTAGGAVFMSVGTDMSKGESLSSGVAVTATSDLEEGLPGSWEEGALEAKLEWVRMRVQDLMLRVVPIRDDIDLQVDLHRDVKLGRVIGEGSSSIVYEGWWLGGAESERHVAVKVLDMDAIGSARERQRFLRAFSRELDTLSRINHPSIVQCYGGCVTGSSVCILLEYLPAGTLAEYVHRDRADNPLSVPEVLAVALQVASALAHLHPFVIHGDVKPDNCLLTANGHVKLGDFGLSKLKWQTAIQPSTTLGTPPYAAPEMLHGALVNEKCDVYSLAMLLWECCIGERPWRDISNPLQLCKLVAEEGMRPKIPDSLDPSVVALIERCWHQKPELRPSAAEAVRKVDLLCATLEQSSSLQSAATARGRAQSVGLAVPTA